MASGDRWAAAMTAEQIADDKRRLIWHGALATDEHALERAFDDRDEDL